MDARRFDKNADQLCQIMNNIRLINPTMSHDVLMYRFEMVNLLERALAINDKLQELTKKGLI